MDGVVCSQKERFAKVIRIRRILPLVVAVLLAACGTASSGNSNSHVRAITPTPKVPHTGQSADQILAGLKSNGLPIGGSVIYTAATDPNALLGRPGQYIGKINFKDTRIPDSGTQGADISVDDGGSIEVFSTTEDATKRLKYVQGIATSISLFSEYDYQDGLVLLRVSHLLTPDQAQEYDTALKALP
jgi:hypothetical protein